MDTKTAATMIRKRIKSECKTLSVTMDRGTAYGWLNVRGSGFCGEFTKDELAALKRLNMNQPGGNFYGLQPSEVTHWGERLVVSPKATYTALTHDWD